MPIIMWSNKKAKRVSFALNDKTQNLEMENKNLAQQIFLILVIISKMQDQMPIKF
ncbi:hypothetical protein MHK_000958 [Candidatus Magnetomorum sp. HK-1]|nr:hypothetical protein MHK_007392 [Candidatus Magnetomorum sp. HK-1]KPA18826.1 hypothetical protein MHK_000958 [Candidatus Magnetomorum sp. HK-1]